MEFRKEDIQVLRTKSRATSQVTLDMDYNVPDVKLDIGRMIQNKGEVTVEEVRLNDGHAFVKGKLQADVLYVGEEDGRVYNLSAGLPASGFCRELSGNGSCPVPCQCREFSFCLPGNMHGNAAPCHLSERLQLWSRH